MRVSAVLPPKGGGFLVAFSLDGAMQTTRCIPALLALAAGVASGFSPQGPLAGQESVRPGLPDAAAIITLQTDTAAQAREAAAAALARNPTPANVAALSQAVLSDPAPMVCAAASKALGAMGMAALPALPALAQAATRDCGPASPPLAALDAVAETLRERAPTLSSEELQLALARFREAEGVLGRPFPESVASSLTVVEGVARSRSLGWVAGILAIVGSLFQNLLSAARSVVGVLSAILLTGLVILLLRNAGKLGTFLKGFGRRGEEGRRGWQEVELWIHRPGALVDRIEASPLRIVGYLRRRAGDRGIELARSDEALEEKWDAFCQSAAGGKIPAFAVSRWVEATVDEAGGGHPPPPATLAEVIRGEVDARYVAGAGTPSRERVETVLQALAWETMKQGRLSGWVSTTELRRGSPDPDWEGVLDYARDRMGRVEVDAEGRRASLKLDEELTARMGSLHLLRGDRVGPSEILAQMGALHAAAHGRDKGQVATYLRRVAGALLDAAAALEGERPDLGIAEEALLALAEPGPGGGGRAPAERIRRLLSRLRAEDHPTVRERIITAMGEMGPDAGPALPALMEAVERDPPGVALASLDTLGRMGTAAAPAAPLLMEAMERGRPSVQAAAVRALGRIGPEGEKGGETLLRWISQGGVPHELHVRAAEALGGMPTHAPAAIPALTELLRSPVASEVRAAAALALARLDPGEREVEEVLKWARKDADPSLEGMLGIALLVRGQRLGSRGRKGVPVAASDWLLPMGVTGSVVAFFQLAAVVGSDILSPRTVLPALFLGPVLAFLGGVVYAVITRRLPLHPALGGGATGWVGASGGLLLGFMVSSAMTPVALVLGGGLALASGAFGAILVRTALDAF